MPVIDVRFDFVRGDETRSENRDIDADSSDLVSDIDGCTHDIYNDLNPGGDDTWEFDGFEVEDYDDDYATPDSFTGLNEYGEYVGKCEEHGEAYRLRYEDIGDFEFDDSYEGCWTSAEEMVQERVEDCHDIPVFLQGRIDWESITRDWMMDYSEYDGNEGTHIFRD